MNNVNNQLNSLSVVFSPLALPSVANLQQTDTNIPPVLRKLSSPNREVIEKTLDSQSRQYQLFPDATKAQANALMESNGDSAANVETVLGNSQSKQNKLDSKKTQANDISEMKAQNKAYVDKNVPQFMGARIKSERKKSSVAYKDHVLDKGEKVIRRILEFPCSVLASGAALTTVIPYTLASIGFFLGIAVEVPVQVIRGKEADFHKRSAFYVLQAIGSMATAITFALKSVLTPIEACATLGIVTVSNRDLLKKVRGIASKCNQQRILISLPQNIPSKTMINTLIPIGAKYVKNVANSIKPNSPDSRDYSITKFVTKKINQISGLMSVSYAMDKQLKTCKFGYNRSAMKYDNNIQYGNVEYYHRKRTVPIVEFFENLIFSPKI